MTPVEKWERYLTPTPTEQRLGMACLGAGRQRGPALCPPRVLPCYAAVLVVDGAGRLELGRAPTSYEVVAPALVWLFPGVPHTYGPDRHGWEEIWTLFEGPAAGAYEELGYLSRARPVQPLTDATTVRHTMENLLRTCRAQRPGVEVTASHLVHELVLAAHRAQADPTGARGAADEAILTALREGAFSPLSVAEQAARLGLSLNALRRAVRRAAGCAPKEYVLRIRLNHAKALLAGSDLTVAEVARAVGHPDPAYFTRVFTRRTGMSPRAFRHQQRRQIATGGTAPPVTRTGVAG